MASDTEANGTDKLVHTLDLTDLGFDDVPQSERTRVKKDIADFLEEEIFRDVANGTSPVRGEGRFQRLDKDYAKDNKGGNRTSNLELEGDLLTDFFVKPTRGSKIKIGHEGGEVPKSDGHNQLSSKAKSHAKKVGSPKRRYIPDDGQTYKARIMDGITRIINSSTVNEQSRRSVDDEEFELSAEPDAVSTDLNTNIADNTSVTFDQLFSDESIDAFFSNALRGKNRG